MVADMHGTADGWTIFLDMDGVCADFVKGALAAHGRLDLYGAPDVTWLPDSIGMSEDDFWPTINALGAAFWRALEPYPWFAALHEGLADLGHVVFLSKPSRGADSATGKLQWLQDRFGPEFRDYIFTPRKRYLSRWPRAILVDDQDKNLEAWDGAPSILFPQLWNAAARMPDPARIVDEILAEVRRLQAQHAALAEP
jgi:hypothetical protein